MKKRFFKGNFFLNFLSAKLFALFCILAFGVGNAWAGYYKGKAVANVDGLSEEKKATVKVLATQTYYYVEGQIRRAHV